MNKKNKKQSREGGGLDRVQRANKHRLEKHAVIPGSWFVERQFTTPVKSLAIHPIPIWSW